MSNSEKANKWIPISKEVPKERGKYITTTMHGEVYCDYWNGVAFDRSETVIAWMPLPQPYAESDTKIDCNKTKCENCINHNYCDYESCDEIWEKAYAERDGKK